MPLNLPIKNLLGILITALALASGCARSAQPLPAIKDSTAVPTEVPAELSQGEPTAVHKLKEAKELRAKGLITEAEYQNLKKKYLAAL